MLTVQGAHCPQELLLLGVRWAETSLALPAWRRAEGRAWGPGRPRDHRARGRAIQSPLGHGVPSPYAVGVGQLAEGRDIPPGKGQWDSLARAVAKTGQTSACLLTEPWDAAATRQTSPAPAGVSVGGPARSYRFRRGTSYPIGLQKQPFTLCARQ